MLWAESWRCARTWGEGRPGGQWRRARAGCGEPLKSCGQGSSHILLPWLLHCVFQSAQCSRALPSPVPWGMCSAWSQLSVRAHKRLENRHEEGSQQSLAWYLSRRICASSDILEGEWINFLEGRRPGSSGCAREINRIFSYLKYGNSFILL